MVSLNVAKWVPFIWLPTLMSILFLWNDSQLQGALEVEDKQSLQVQLEHRGETPRGAQPNLFWCQ